MTDWNDYLQIAEALSRQHAYENYMTMPDDRLRRLVVALPDFRDALEPPDKRRLSLIRYAWIAAAADEPDDNSPAGSLS